MGLITFEPLIDKLGVKKIKLLNHTPEYDEFNLIYDERYHMWKWI